MSKAITASTLRFKGINNIFFAVALAIISLITLLNSESIRAQITNLYSASNDQVAGITSLMTAVASNDVEGIKFFIKGGTPIINQRNFGGATALHIAAREQNLEIANLLVENGADVNIADNEGWTPLMRAARVGNSQLVNLFLDKGADASALNSTNETAIIQATTADCDQCLVAMFDKFNFIKLMNSAVLTQQINDSYLVARNHENEQVQKILADYLEKVSKMTALLEPQEVDLNQASPSINTVAPVQSNKSGKKIKFTGLAKNKIDAVEVVEPVSIKKETVASVTEASLADAQPQEQNLEKKKIVYKFLGQTGSSIAVQNYQAQVQGLLKNDKSKAEVVAKSSEVSANKTYKFNGQTGSSTAVKNYDQQHQEPEVSSTPAVENNSASESAPKVFKFKKN